MLRNALNTKLEMQAAEPLYKQVQKQIMNCLAEGEWVPGDRLPTESQLAERFGVAVLTVRAGIRDLVNSNILVRKQGSGTYVARHDRQRQRYQFTHMFRDDGAKTLPERRLVSFTKVAADSTSAEYLHLPATDKLVLFRIECLLKLDGRDIALMDIMIPARLFTGLTARTIAKSEENLYAVYQDVCNVNVIRIKEHVYAVKAGTRAAKILDISASEPVLRIDRIAYTYNDVPVEFRRRTHVASNFHYELDEGGI